MQNIEVVCVLDGAKYKEYQLLIDTQPVGVISWKSEPGAAKSCWYTTASDGQTHYFQSLNAAIKFVKNNPLRITNEATAKLKAEANKIIDIAQELEA